jgi:hypothetical protein
MSISIQEYRKIMSDETSTDDQILKRLNYLEALCRNVIKQELENFQKNAPKRLHNHVTF